MNDDSAPSTRLKGKWLYLARLGWFALALAILVPLVIALPMRMQQLRDDPYRLAPVLSRLGLDIDFFVLYGTLLEAMLSAACLAIALAILWRKSDDWMGLLVSLGLVSFLGLLPPVTALSQTNPEWRIPIIAIRMLSVLIVLLIFYLFPDGRFIPSWTRFLALFFAVTLPLWLLIPSLALPAAPADIQSRAQMLVIGWVILVFSSGVVAQLYRFRKVSGNVQRQQTKWVVFGFVGVFLGLFLSALPVILFPSLRTPGIQNFVYLMLAIPVALFCWFLFPLSLGISILRYHLWDIDIIIRRTLVYGGLSGSLALVFFFSVVVLQSLVTIFGGQRSALVTVISTLLIAALFNPLRQRVQNFIDRRFYRRKYDAEKALSAFADTARDEVDMDRLAGALLGVVEETIQPEGISLWLKKVA